MGEREVQLLYKAFKEWATDTPARIWGLVLAILAFVGALIFIAVWVSQCLPPLYVWIAFGVVIIATIWFSFVPYYKREQHKVSSVITNMAYMEAFIIDGKDFLDGFKNTVVVLTHDKNRAKQWQIDVAEYLRKNLPDEYILWHRYTAINFQEAEQPECIAFMETGLSRLESIHASLRQDCKRG